ncbi:hypothetical protein UlMin_043294 [Ulmus minor]
MARQIAPSPNFSNFSLHAPPLALAQQGGGRSLLGGIGSTIAQGMTFGTGSVLAHRAVDVVLGPRTIQHEIVASEAAVTLEAPTANNFGGSDASSIHTKAFQDCQFYMDMLIECRKNSGGMLRA